MGSTAIKAETREICKISSKYTIKTQKRHI